MNHMIDELTRSCYIYGLSSLAHDSEAMMLESHSRQSRGEDVCWLILTCDRIELHLRLVSRSNFADSVNEVATLLLTQSHNVLFMILLDLAALERPRWSVCDSTRLPAVAELDVPATHDFNIKRCLFFF